MPVTKLCIPNWPRNPLSISFWIMPFCSPIGPSAVSPCTSTLAWPSSTITGILADRSLGLKFSLNLLYLSHFHTATGRAHGEPCHRALEEHHILGQVLEELSGTEVQGPPPRSAMALTVKISKLQNRLVYLCAHKVLTSRFIVGLSTSPLVRKFRTLRSVDSARKLLGSPWPSWSSIRHRGRRSCSLCAICSPVHGSQLPP